jgi:acetamidase/formamidase
VSEASRCTVPLGFSFLIPTLVVPACGKIANNEVVKIECLDWTGGQIQNNDSAEDVRTVDLTEIHYLSGPFDIETAEPGDVLLVEIQDVQPFQDQPWGFTGVFAKENGGGFLDEIYPKAYVEFPLLDMFILILVGAVRKQFGILKASSVLVGIFPESVLLG